jgi:ribosomal protein S18 acetylase RimI-like enzyme
MTDPGTPSFRLLAEADLADADRILQAAFAGSASRLHDLQLYRRIQPDGWFAACREKELVGLGGSASYGPFAHVGLVAVHPGFQRQGIGHALMDFILARLEQQRVPGVLLDASEMGRPLYARMGFLDYGETLVYQRENGSIHEEQPPGAQLISGRQIEELAAWDAEIFGADRRRVIQTLVEVFPERAFLQRDGRGKLAGYIVAQQNRIGPWVSLRSDHAAELLRRVLSLDYGGTLSAAVPAENHEAIELLEAQGFERVRSNRHMGRGIQNLPGQRQYVYAQTSLAIG